MKISASLTALFLIFAVGASPQEKPKRKKLLAIGRSEGYQHDSISHGLATIWKIGQQSGLLRGSSATFAPAALHAATAAGSTGLFGSISPAR